MEHTTPRTQHMTCFPSGSSGMKTVRVVPFHSSSPSKVHVGLGMAVQAVCDLVPGDASPPPPAVSKMGCLHDTRATSAISTYPKQLRPLVPLTFEHTALLSYNLLPFSSLFLTAPSSSFQGGLDYVLLLGKIFPVSQTGQIPPKPGFFLPGIDASGTSLHFPWWIVTMWPLVCPFTPWASMCHIYHCASRP